MKTIEKPERIYKVSATQLSIGRHYGGCNVNGAYYCYDPRSDTLIREDVLKAEVAEIKKAAADKKKKQQAAQQSFTEF